MNSPISQTPRAIALMVAAIFCFTVMDAIVKGLAPDIGIMPTLWARYAGQMLIVTVLIWPRRKTVVRTNYPKIQILRSFALMGATWFFFTGLANIGLAEASAIMGVNPVLITLGAALFLGERLGIRRIVGIGAALIGALIIIRPGSDVFSLYAFFPLAAATCYSCYALLTRFVGSDEDVWTSLFYTGLVGMVVLTALMPFVWQGASATDWIKMGCIAAVGTTGQLLLIRALRLGEASMLAPFSYTGLIFAIFWGALFYNEFPDQWTLLGAVVIAGAGIYVWYRENLSQIEALLMTKPAPNTPALTRATQFCSNAALRAMIGVTMALPYATRVRMMGWIVSNIVAKIAGYDKRVRANLKLCFPDMPEAEIQTLCRSVANNAGRTLIEIYSGSEFTARAAKAPISGPGLAPFEAARADGRPVILVTGHFGNYDVSRAHLIAKGHNMGALYRKMSNPYFNTHYVRSISKIGTPLFEQGRRGMMELVKHLRGGGILGILTDLFAMGGAPLTFFGQTAVTSTVTAELALKYNAALIPIYAIRQPNGLDFEIIVQEEIVHSDPVTMTQQINDRLEDLVRDHMDQWFWIHRRWKDDPSV